jgi:hypothetical protein
MTFSSGEIRILCDVLREYLETPAGKALVHAALTGSPIPSPYFAPDEGGA